jgi:uncharacterized protein YceH (UPF0502 family)
LSAIDRRVAGVLVEKAKTTPDGYPMTINGLVAGCNQKSNRFPAMQVEADDVEASLDRLRALGAVGIVQGSGRVDKFRHYLYEWLGVEKVEMAVMTELLLRGAQTEGELRGRASRMEPIADLSALRPVIESLKAKGLVVPLTPEGRGHVVTHALYEPRELEKVRAQAAGGEFSASPADAAPDAAPLPLAAAPNRAAHVSVAVGGPDPLDELRNEVRQLRADLEDTVAALRASRDEIARLRDGLGM